MPHNNNYKKEKAHSSIDAILSLHVKSKSKKLYYTYDVSRVPCNFHPFFHVPFIFENEPALWRRVCNKAGCSYNNTLSPSCAKKTRALALYFSINANNNNDEYNSALFICNNGADCFFLFLFNLLRYGETDTCVNTCPWYYILQSVASSVTKVLIFWTAMGSEWLVKAI